MAAPDYDVIKEIPGYKVILKAVLKSQIQQLVEQLASSTDEESVILTASVADGTLSHLGSDSGKGFLEDHEDIKSQFLGFCLKKHHRKKQEEKERQEAEALQQSMQASPGRFGGPRGPYGPRSPRFASPRGHSPIHPIALTRASPGSQIRSPGVRHEPYPLTRPPKMRRTSLNFDQGKNPMMGPSQTPMRSPSANRLDGQVIKIEPEEENDGSNQSESDTVSQEKPGSSSQSPSHPTNAPSSVKSESGEKDDDARSESSNSTIPNEAPSEGLSLDSDLSNLISGSTQQQSSETNETDPDVSVKLEALTENEMELEITGVEPGRPVMPQDNWDPNVSMGMNFDPTGATGNQGDMAAQGYKQSGTRPKSGVVSNDIAKEFNMVEVYAGTDVYWTRSQRDFVLFNGNRPEQLLSKALDVFFSKEVLMRSSAMGGGNFQPLNEAIVNACICFVQRRWEVKTSHLTKVINDKCSNARRPKRTGLYSHDKYIKCKNARKTMNNQ